MIKTTQGKIRASLTLYLDDYWPTYFGSDTRHPMTPSNPRVWPRIAAVAIVLTLLGAKGHRSRTGPVKKNNYRRLKLEHVCPAFVSLPVTSSCYRLYRYIYTCYLRIMWLLCQLQRCFSRQANRQLSTSMGVSSSLP